MLAHNLGWIENQFQIQTRRFLFFLFFFNAKRSQKYITIKIRISLYKNEGNDFAQMSVGGQEKKSRRFVKRQARFHGFHPNRTQITSAKAAAAQLREANERLQL